MFEKHKTWITTLQEKVMSKVIDKGNPSDQPQVVKIDYTVKQAKVPGENPVEVKKDKKKK